MLVCVVTVRLVGGKSGQEGRLEVFFGESIKYAFTAYVYCVCLMYVCITYVCMRMPIYVPVHKCMYVYMCVYVHTRKCKCTYV